jgi:osmotically inducible lipoprotein OsmB
MATARVNALEDSHLPEEGDRSMKTKSKVNTIIAVVFSTGLVACAHWTPAEQGTAIGGVTGAAVGNAITGGSALGIIGGAAVGGVIGHEVGRDQERDRRYRRQ